MWYGGGLLGSGNATTQARSYGGYTMRGRAKVGARSEGGTTLPKKTKAKAQPVRGRIDAPYLFVTLFPESDASLRWLWGALLDNLGVSHTDIRVVSLLDGPPEGAKDAPTQAQLTKNADRFRAAMAESCPKVTIPLGPYAYRAITGMRIGIDDARGYVLGPEYMGKVEKQVMQQIGTYKTKKKGKYNVGDPRMGKVKIGVAPPLPGNYNAAFGPVLPMYSLQQLQKSQFKLSWVMVADLRRAKRVVGGTFKYACDGFEYFVRPGVMAGRTGEEWIADEAYPDMRGPYVAFDIETVGKTNVVKQISMSDGATTVAFPWTEEVRLWAQRQFDRPGVIWIGHNLMFDVPRLKLAGIVFGDDMVFFDTMLAAAMMQPDVPKGLGKVGSMYLDVRPWKWRTLSEADEDLYSALDAFHTWCLAVEQLIPAMQEVA